MVKLSNQISKVANKNKIAEIRIVGSTNLLADEDFCFGQEVLIHDYPELFAEIKYTFGQGNSPNSFRLPDLRGVILSGSDTMGTWSAGRLRNVISTLGVPDGFQGSWIDAINSQNPLWDNSNSMQSSNKSEIPATMLAKSDFHPTVSTGLDSGTGGQTLYSTNQYSAPKANGQPTQIMVYAINLGRNRVSYDPVPQPPDALTDLEFNGPFVDWFNVVTDFGADPTGTTDSTAAFQTAINAACRRESKGNNSNWETYVSCQILYVPAGTYLISESLRFGDSRTIPSTPAEGFAIFGEDPETTILKWVGSNSTRTSILWAAGWHDGICARLQLDGQGTNVTGFRYERDFGVPMNQSYNRVQDCIFKDLACGVANTDYITGASTDSEISIYRCRFYRCTNYGVTTIAAEAYDYYIRGCYFEQCGKAVGVQLSDGYWDMYPHVRYWNGAGGQLSVYDSVFNGSLICDCYGIHGGNIGVRRNTSINSQRFYIGAAGQIAITDNRIIYPVFTDCINQISQSGQRYHNWMANNEFCMRPDAQGPIYKELYNVDYDPEYPPRYSPTQANDKRCNDTTLMIYNNKFNVAYEDVFDIDPRYSYVSFDNKINQTINDTLPNITAIPPKVSRQIFYIYPDTWAGDGYPHPPIQEQINTAVTYAQENPTAWPIIYAPVFANGPVLTTRPLEIAANTNIIMAGSGFVSGWRLTPVYSSDNLGIPWMILRGPSKVKLYWQSITVYFAKWGRQIIIDNCEQQGSRVILDSCHQSIRTFTSNTAVIINDWNSSEYNTSSLASSNWNLAGDGYLLIDGGAASSDVPAGLDPQRFPLMEIQSGTEAHIRDIWYESNVLNKNLFWLRGNNSVQDSLFSFECGRIGIFTDGQWYNLSNIKYENFKGKAVVFSGGGFANIIGDSSQFSYQCWSGVPAVDHGYVLTEYNGVQLNFKGRVYYSGSSPYNPAYASNLNLSGWPNSYTGDIGDLYLADDTGHSWVWDGATWVDIGGVIGTIGRKEQLPGWPTSYVSALPPSYSWVWTGSSFQTKLLSNSSFNQPRTGDAFFVLNTMTLWQWNGSQWIERTGMPMPAQYWHYMSSPARTQTTTNQEVFHWFSKAPNGVAGALPNNYGETLDYLSSLKPILNPQPLPDGVTDVRMEHCWLNVETWPGQYDNTIYNDISVWYDAGNIQSYPRHQLVWYSLGPSSNNANQQGYVNFLFDNNGCFEFNGLDTYYSLTTMSGLPYGSNPCTIICWAKTYSTSGGYKWIFGYGSPTTEQSRSLGINGSVAVWSGYQDDVTGGSIVENQWFQLAGTFDGTTATLYINGVNTSNNTVSWNTVSSTAQIGRQTNNNEYWNGTIGIVQVYNTALNDSNILSNFNTYKSRYGL